MVSVFYNPKKQGWYSDIKDRGFQFSKVLFISARLKNQIKTLTQMVDEKTFHIKNTDFKGSFMSEFDIKNGEKSFYKIQTGLTSYVDCEVSS